MSGFFALVNRDSVEVFCPCGASIEGEGNIISEFKKKHAAHTDGTYSETITSDGLKAVETTEAEN